MYTLEQLQQKTFKELKEIGWQLNVFPAGDRRCRSNWIDALASSVLPLLKNSPGVEVEPVQEAIEIQRQEPIESKFSRIVYPKPAAEPIAQTSETSPGVSFDVDEFRQTHAVEVESYFKSFTECDRPPNRGDGRGRLENELKVSQSAIAPVTEKSPGVDRSKSKSSIAHQLLDLFKSSADVLEPIEPQRQEHTSLIPCQLFQVIEQVSENSPSVALSPRFLALYSPPQPNNIFYQADANGQLSLLDFEVQSEPEPPDPDDYSTEFEFWAAYDVYCDRPTDISELPSSFSEFTEPIELSLSSMLEWAPCPDQWWNETSTVSSTLEGSPVSIELSSMLELSPPMTSSNTSDFSIPVFGAAGDRQNDTDEPPDTGIFARLPGPKPPSFPPMVVVAGDRSYIKKFARSATILSGRSPPGGDVTNR